MVTLKACVNWKLSETSSVTVDVVVEADTSSEATEALKATIKDLEGAEEA